MEIQDQLKQIFKTIFKLDCNTPFETLKDNAELKQHPELQKLYQCLTDGTHHCEKSYRTYLNTTVQSIELKKPKTELDKVFLHEIEEQIYSLENSPSLRL